MDDHKFAYAETIITVDPIIDAQIDEYFAKRLPKSRKLGSIKELIIHREFFDSCACLFAEGVEFMTKEQIYQAIKEDFQKAVVALR